MAEVIDQVQFGTDGWRAIIDEDFNPRSVARVSEAAAKVFKEQQAEDVRGPETSPDANTILIGYDCRLNAGRYAALVATVVADAGFDVLVSDRYCPTPALCWTIAHSPHIIGGIMLTSSHNPAEYLGIKLRMQDGGASPKHFTDRVEAALADAVPPGFERAQANFALAANGTPSAPAQAIAEAPELTFTNIMDAYLDALRSTVDTEAIRSAGLNIVLDPLYGAGRGYLSGLFRELSVTVVEVNAATDPTFDGLHPEPIMPWVKVGAQKVAELGYDACFITDGDADRIGALDDTGAYVSSHRILTLLVGHLYDKGLRGKVVRNLAGSSLLKRQCARLDLELVTTPVGFKWIYEQMLAGGVLIGGEESGGMGIPSHVRERDGLLMSLLLAELMAKKGQSLRELVNEMLTTLGALEYARRDLRLSPEQKDTFLADHVNGRNHDASHYAKLFAPTGEKLSEVNYVDGIKFYFESDAWLLIRPSGTEPLVRVYAEAATDDQVEALLDIGCALAQG